MNPPPDRELLSQSAARQLLERAGEIDSDSTTVDTLRAAAREAGISEAAFEAALVEMRGQQMPRSALRGHRPARRWAAAIAATAIFFGAMTMVVIPRLVRPATPPVEDHTILVRCLPMKTAQEIAQALMTEPGNEVQLSAGSRYLRIRATNDQMAIIQSAFDAKAKQLDKCDNTTIR
jgi:hypothetical protein